jgi:hypothetical protein
MTSELTFPSPNKHVFEQIVAEMSYEVPLPRDS